MLNARDAVRQVRRLLEWRTAEVERLDEFHAYARGRQDFPALPNGVPSDVSRLAQMSRVNIVGLVVDVPTQSMFVDGYRKARASEDAPAWSLWQANRLDARQAGVHRAAFKYGVAYTTVLPGSPTAVIRGHSPRNMTAMYGDDPDWPMWALERTPTNGTAMFRLYDDEAVYDVGEEDDELTFIEANEHQLGVCPVVRFRNVEDLDAEAISEVEPLIPLQDQIDLTTFDLLVAQHFAAFRQRYIIGWTSEDENEKAKAGASRLWTFDDSAQDVKVGEFDQTDLTGYLESREATLQHLATISQTPPHYLLGKLVNLSAEALVAAEVSQRRKIGSREMTFGESWEQTLELGAVAAGEEADLEAQARWQDTEARSMGATVDALGKLATMLGVPPQALWERVPGVTQQDVAAWKAAAAQSDVLGNLAGMLDRQMGEGDVGTVVDAEDLKQKADALGVLIRNGVEPADAAARVGLAGLRFTGAVPVTLRMPAADAEALED